MKNIVCINGDFVAEKNICIPINNRGFLYGDGFFETLKVSNHKILFSDLHLQRIQNTLSILGYKDPNHYNFKELINELCIKNECKGSARIKIIFTRKPGGYYTPEKHDFDFVITYEELQESLYGQSLIKKAGVYPDWTKSSSKYNNLKLLSAAIYVQASDYASKNGFDDVFILNGRNNIIETSRANIFAVKEGVIYTPPLSDDCLDGVFRKNLLTNSEKLGIKIIERSLSKEFLVQADEVFTTNVIKGISSVLNFENSNYKNSFASELTKRIEKELQSE